jgi:hypothetical protein
MTHTAQPAPPLLQSHESRKRACTIGPIEYSPLGISMADDVLEILRILVKRFRWRNQGYDRLICPSCGALARWDDESGQISRTDQCSPSCPWRRAEEAAGVTGSFGE